MHLGIQHQRRLLPVIRLLAVGGFAGLRFAALRQNILQRLNGFGVSLASYRKSLLLLEIAQSIFRFFAEISVNGQ